MCRQKWRTGGVLLLQRAANQSLGCQRPVYVRLPQDDRLLLESRAASRGLRPATYISVLTRAHLRSLAPLPKEEYLALKRCIGDLGTIGRNINQLARVANESGKAPTSVRGGISRNAQDLRGPARQHQGATEG